MGPHISSYSDIAFVPTSMLKEGMQTIAKNQKGMSALATDGLIYAVVLGTLLKEQGQMISERHFPTDWAQRIANVFSKEIDAGLIEFAFASTIKGNGPANYGQLNINLT